MCFIINRNFGILQMAVKQVNFELFTFTSLADESRYSLRDRNIILIL